MTVVIPIANTTLKPSPSPINFPNTCQTNTSLGQVTQTTQKKNIPALAFRHGILPNTVYQSSFQEHERDFAVTYHTDYSS